MMRIVVLSDTHAPRRWKACPPAVASQLRDADLILHAGDVCTAPVLDELAQYAPVTAVVGNNDGPDVAAWGAAETAALAPEGLPVAMIHDSGTATGRLPRLRARFPRRSSSSSATRTSRSTSPTGPCGSSIPAPRPTAAASRTARWACCTSRTAPSSRPGSSRSPELQGQIKPVLSNGP